MYFNTFLIFLNKSELASSQLDYQLGLTVQQV